MQKAYSTQYLTHECTHSIFIQSIQKLGSVAGLYIVHIKYTVRPLYVHVYLIVGF